MAFFGVFGALGGGGGCIDLAIFSLGCSVEESTRIRNNLESKITTSVQTNAKSAIEQVAVVNASIIIHNSATGRMECNLNVENTVTGDIQFVAKSNQQVVSTVTEAMKTSLDNALKSLNSQQTEFLSKAANGKSITDVVNEMKNSIDTSINTNVINSIIQKIHVGANINFTNDGLIVGNTCNFKNTVALNLFSSAVISQVVQTVLQIDDVASIISYVEKEVKIENKGLASLLKWLIPLLIVGFIIFIVGYLIYNREKNRAAKTALSMATTAAANPLASFNPSTASSFLSQSIPTPMSMATK